MIEGWLRAHRHAVLAAILALAAAVRVVAFVQAEDGPCLALHRWQATDMAFFDEWGRAIVAGDWLGRRTLHPYHPWHQELTEGWLAVHPEVAEQLAAEGIDAPDRGRALWERWSGGPIFHQEPLYAYLTAVTYALAGPDVRAVILWQLALGVAMTALLVLVVRRALGHSVATVTGVLVALAGPLVFHELLLLRETLVAALGVLLVSVTERARTVQSRRSWLVVGLVLGTALLAKTIYAVFGLGVVAALVLGRGRTGLVPAGALLGGTALALAPLVARNLTVGAPALALSGTGTIVFVLSNAVDFRPGVGFVVSEHTRAIMGGTGGALLPAVRATLASHPDWWSVLHMLAGKWATIWHWYEVPNNANFYFFRLHVGVLRVLPVTFLVLSPLGLVGLGLGLRAVRRAWPLYLLVVCHVTHLMVFYTLSRLRLPLLPALAPFAALTIVDVGRALAGRRVLAALVPAAAAAAVAVWTSRPLAPGQPLVGAVDYWAASLTYYRPLIEQAERDGDFERAVAVFRASLAFEPEAVRRVGADEPPRAGAEADLAGFFASVHDAFARELATAGHAEEAEREAERARELAAVAGTDLTS